MKYDYDEYQLIFNVVSEKSMKDIMKIVFRNEDLLGYRVTKCEDTDYENIIFFNKKEQEYNLIEEIEDSFFF